VHLLKLVTLLINHAKCLFIITNSQHSLIHHYTADHHCATSVK